MAPEGFTRLRDLGNLEKYSSTRHALGLYNNVSITAYYSKSSSSHALRTIIPLAVAYVIKDHPILSAIPVEEDLPSAHFRRLRSIDLGQAVAFIERKKPFDGAGRDVELDEVLEQQHNINFKEGLGDRPFWRLIILLQYNDPSNFTASYVFHHALADGGSGVAFHRALHAALVKVSSGPRQSSTRGPLIVASPRTALVPSLEEVLRLPLTIWFIILTIWQSIFPSTPRKLWTGKPISFTYRKRRIHTIAIPQHQTASLLAAARSQAVSLTATIPVLLGRAVLGNLDATEYDTLRANMPISLRHCLSNAKVDSDTIGVYVSQAQTLYKWGDILPLTGARFKPDTIWRAARRTKADLQAAVARNGKNDEVGLLRWAGPLKAFFQQKEGRQPDSSFEFSNVGVFKHASEPGAGDWMVGRVVFGQDGNVCGPVFQASGATGSDGVLTVSFAWLDGQIEEEWMMRVVSGLEDEIWSLLEEIEYEKDIW